MTTVRLPLTLPPYTPSTWELELPGYPVITNSWRSSAFPELLGSLPNDAKWTLTFENQTSSEALALLLPWRATGGGQWALTTLPDELAGGVDNANFRKRLTGTTWTIAEEPQKESVKNGRFNVTVKLIHELTLDSVYGPDNPRSPDTSDNPLALLLPTILTVSGLPTEFIDIFQSIKIEPYEKYITTLDGKVIIAIDGDALVTNLEWLVLKTSLSSTLSIAGLPTELDKTARIDVSSSMLNLGLATALNPIALPNQFSEPLITRNADPVIAMNLSAAMSVAGTVLQSLDIPVNSIIYSQSSVFPSTFAADNLSMTDKTLVNTGAATDLGNPAWIKMSLGRNYGVAKVIIGTATNAIPGSWNKSYTENKIVEYSSDDINWTTAFNTGTFAAEGIYEFVVNLTARHIRIRTTSNDYVALSEFYALGAGQTY